MEKGVLVAEPAGDHGELPPCTCKSAQCAHCCLHEALRARECSGSSIDKLHLGACDGNGDENSHVSMHPRSQSHLSSMNLTAGAHSMQIGAARKLKLPCRRNSRSSLVAPSSHERLSKRAWPPLPLHGAPSENSSAYTDACLDPQTPYVSPHKVDLQMLSLTSSSFEHEQENTSKYPLFEQQFTSGEKSIKPMSSLPSNGNPRRICRYCNREFPSGRALGGHMRVHGGLDSDRTTASGIDTKLEHTEFNASMHRSSSPRVNLASEYQSTEVNCRVSGSPALNSNNESVIRRRINSAESLVRGIDEKKMVSMGGVTAEQAPVCGVKEKQSLERREQLVQSIKEDQVAIEKGISAKGQTSSPQAKRSSSIHQDLDTEHVHDDGDEDGNLCLLSSKLMVVGTANELTNPVVTKQGNMASSASECNVDEENLLQKLRPNPRPSRHRLWTDQEGASANSKKENSTSHLQSSMGRLSSSPPALQGSQERAPAERACSCSECGKVFWSWKALFGHMRCHPEREWRGIQRPDVCSSELEKQVRAPRKLSSLRVPATSNVEKETGLESDTENREVLESTQTASSISAIVKVENSVTRDRVQETDHMQGPSREIKEEVVLETSKRGLKNNFPPDSTDDEELTPAAWPTRKRSRRNRASIGTPLKVSSVTSTEPALTSETATSSELRDNEKVSVRDQEDLDMANCLVLLSNAGNEVPDTTKRYLRSTEESARKRRIVSEPFRRQANVVSSNEIVGGDDDDSDENEAEYDAAEVAGDSNAGSGLKYECSTCKRCFKSHQALGGHRASHRKTKGCFALMNQNVEESMQDGKEEQNAESDEFASSELNQWQAMGHVLSVAPSCHTRRDERKAQSHLMLSPSTTDLSPTSSSKKKKFKGHACTICHRIFPSGQALGGHKRCHWTGEKIAESGSMASSSNNKGFMQEQACWGGRGDASALNDRRAKRNKEDGIDLNLPAPLDEDDEAGYENTGLSSTEMMEPDTHNDVEEVCLDEEEANEGHVVDYIGGKRRSVNKLYGERDAEDTKRQHGSSAMPAGGTELMDEDYAVKRRHEKRASTGGSMWDLQWTNAASSSTGPSISQVRAMQPL